MPGGHDLETGVKYILRQTDSEITQRLYDETSGNWHEPSGSFVDFSHTQHIYSVYLGGTFRWNKLGIKAGVRAEGTSLDVSYSNDLTKDFHSNFVDIVPNVTLSYSIGQSQQIRLGYNMRIQRAGIDYLNPYVDERDPLNVSYGNPDLDSEKSNSVNLNYTLFTQKFNINASVSHAFVNNSIEQYTFMDTERPNVSVSTYGNIGKRHQTGFSLYMNWSPLPLFRFLHEWWRGLYQYGKRGKKLVEQRLERTCFRRCPIFVSERFLAEHERRLYVTQDSIARGTIRFPVSRHYLE